MGSVENSQIAPRTFGQASVLCLYQDVMFEVLIFSILVQAARAEIP